jgi:hypothetical protein
LQKTVSRKNKQKKRRKIERAANGDIAMLFVQELWESLKALCKGQAHFGLQLILKHEQVLHFFCEKLLGKKMENISWSTLQNGYDLIEASGPEIFFDDPDEWRKVTEVFQWHKLFRS